MLFCFWIVFAVVFFNDRDCCEWNELELEINLNVWTILSLIAVTVIEIENCNAGTPLLTNSTLYDLKPFRWFATGLEWPFSEFASVQGNNNSKRLAVFTFQGPKPAHPSVPGHVVSLSLKLSMTHSPSVPGHVVSLSLKSLSAITFPFGGFGCFGCLVSSGFGGFGVFGGFGGFVFLSSSSVSSSSSWCLAPIQWSSSVQWAQQWHNLKFEMSHYLKTKIKCHAIKAIGLHVGDLHAWTSLSSWCPSRGCVFPQPHGAALLDLGLGQSSTPTSVQVIFYVIHRRWKYEK